MTKAVCHRLAVGGGGLVDEDDEMAAESGLHVGIDVAEAGSPPHPRLPHEAGHDPAVDVAAAVVAEVQNQGGAVGHRVEITGPLGVVRRAHRAKMDIADLIAACCVDAATTLLLPIGVAGLGESASGADFGSLTSSFFFGVGSDCLAVERSSSG